MLRALTVVAVAATASEAMSASAIPSGASGDFADAHDLTRLWPDADARQPVIVEFAMPALPDKAGFATPELADAAQTRAIHAVQDRILGRFRGSPTEIARAQAAPDLILKRMAFSPLFGINVTRAESDMLAADPDVVRIHEDRLSAPALLQSLPLIQMPQAYAAGATGNGYHVAVIDTGARRTHEFLAGRVVSAACYSTTNPNIGSTSTCPGGAASSTDINSAPDCNEAEAQGCGHGTHVSGIVAGFNTNLQAGEPQNGVARDSRLIVINVHSRFGVGSNRCFDQSMPCILAFGSDELAALERVYALRNTFQIAAVNMSLGGGIFNSNCDFDTRKTVIDQLRAANIATVVAAGNGSSNTGVSVPGCISTAITVANSTKSDLRSFISNWSPQVDVAAPGTDILSSFPNTNSEYIALLSTSMATAHVSGAWAALRTARPNATVTEIESALKSTGLNITSGGITKPRIRVHNALAALPGTTNVVAAVLPAARVTQVNGTVTALASVINVGSAMGIGCSIALPPGAANITFTYRTVAGNGTLGPVNTPVAIAAGATQNFVMSFRPSAVMSTNLALVFRCTNAVAAPSTNGLNRFLLTATTAAPADIISTAATPSGDGIMNVPLGNTGVAAVAAINIGVSANLEARASANAIGSTSASLPGNLLLCRTDPSTGQCQTHFINATIPFSLGANQTATFTAFFQSNGTPIPFDPANKRFFINFFQGATAVGSTSVAIRTAGSDGSSTASAE